MGNDKKIVRIIRKSNHLVEGKYHFNIWETRVFTKMLTLISKDDEDFKEYRIFLKDVVQDFDLKDKNSYAWIKKGAEGLAKKEIRVIRQTSEGEKEFMTHIAIGVESFTKNGNYVDISFHPKMKPFLLQLQTQFLMYDVENITKLQSFYSIRIYELLKQYEKIGKRSISIQELKEMLAIEDKYSHYGHFKKRIISQAQKDLEKSTDISFTFEEVKHGRQVVSLTFFIKKNSKGTNSSAKKEVGVELLTFEEQLYKKIANLSGATEKTFNTWVKNYGIEHVRRRTDFVLDKINREESIVNPMGLLQTLMKQSSFTSPLEEQSKMKQAEKQLRQEREENLTEQKRIDTDRIDLFKRYQAAMLKHLTNLLETEADLGVKVLRLLRETDPKPLNIQLALDHYKRLMNYDEGHPKETLYNFEAGGAFFLIFESYLSNQYPLFQKMTNQYYSRLEKLV
jgi:plasmid replication initiation protein